jgi:hypothetical protein
MKTIQTDIDQLKSILSTCKLVGVDGIVIHEGLARGAPVSLNAAILTEAKMSFSPDFRIGIGRVSELEKRLNIFSGPVEIEGKVNDKGDVSMLTLSSGKTKVQFRCTSASLMTYPKVNEDQPVAMITFTKTEVQQANKAVKTLGATDIVIQISRTGVAKLECSDSANDRFDVELATEVEFVEDAESIVQTYLASILVDVLDAACKNSEEITIVLGEAGSITAVANGHTLLVLPQINGEE